MSDDRFYKNNESDNVWWVSTEAVGEFVFSFDKKHLFNLYSDYPHKLTSEQVEIFDKENPLWADYFKDRKKENSVTGGDN